MSKFEESKFYKSLQDFFINNNKDTFLQFLAEFYNRTESIIDKNNIQDDLIKELRELYLEFNEKGIDNNIVREKVNYFLENSVKIKDVITKLNTNTNNIKNINSQMDTIAKYNNVINLGKLGLTSENVNYNQSTKTYNMTDISNTIKTAINTNCDTIIFPQGNYLIENTITIDKPLTLIGNGCNIYSSPSSTTKIVFKINSKNVNIEGFNFYSAKDYNMNLAGSTSNSSNIQAINILGDSSNYITNINIKNCYGENLSYLISSMYSKNVSINNCSCYEVYFHFYSDNSIDIKIDKCNFSGQLSTDVYAHVLYFGHETHNAVVTNCILTQNGVDGANIVKCGTNNGPSGNIKLTDCTLNGVGSSLFYIDTISVLEIINCRVTWKSKSGYARVLQLINNSVVKFFNCECEFDGFDRYTQGYNLTNSLIEFSNCEITIKNTIEQYSYLPFVSGCKMKFDNCTFNININYSYNLMSPDFLHVEFFNCIFHSNVKLFIGYYDADSVNYTKTTTPILKMYNCIFENLSESAMGVNTFFMNISKEGFTPQCHIVNFAGYKCSGTSGGNLGKLFMTNAESQYIKNNAIDLTP